jgi:transposase
MNQNRADHVSQLKNKTRKLWSLQQKDENATSSKIQQEMEKKGVDITARTVRRRLHEAGGTYSSPLLKPLLSEKHRNQRLIWAKKHKNFDWRKVLFTDESTFYLNRPAGKTWNLPGKRKVVRTVKHPAKVHVWGCFSASGFGEIFCFQRNLDAKFMCTIYEKGLLPSAQNLFGDENESWILQEDNDPKHRSKLAKEWKKTNDIRELPWPSMSPDQNPIENVWSLMKINIRKKKIRTVRGLRKELQTEWHNLPSQLAENLVKSMERRVTALLHMNGDYTLY